MKKSQSSCLGIIGGLVIFLISAWGIQSNGHLPPLSRGNAIDREGLHAGSPAEGGTGEALASGRIPIDFIPNFGQMNSEVSFCAKTRRGNLWLTKDGLVLDSARLVFRGARPEVRLRALEASGHRVNSFIGNDPSQWKTDIPAFRGVVYEGIYDRIDLKLYGREGWVEYDWLVRPGGDPRAIRFEFHGAEGTSIDGGGNLVIRTPSGDVIHRRPVSYQMKNGRKSPVDVRFKIISDDLYGFDISAYDPRAILVIDPVVLVFSTYLGGNDSDSGGPIAVDDSGYVYVAGYTTSSNFPVKNALFPIERGGGDIFLTKLSPSGKSIVFSTYFGGAKNFDAAVAISVDGSGAIYLAGWTRSQDFPMKRAYDPHGSEGGQADGFVTKFVPAGNALVFSTFLGGSDEERVSGMAVDDTGAVYVAGHTYSSDFPVKKAFDATLDGETDAFLTKFHPSGRSLIFSTYLGGSERDNACGGIAVDASRSAYLTGYTASVDFPAVNAFDGSFGGEFDGFFAKFNPAGNALVYASYLGGKEYELANACAVDDEGSLYVTGLTRSVDFPVQNAYDSRWNGKEDVFLTKVAPSGQILVYSTFLGGPAQDEAYGIAVDASRCAYVAGFTRSASFPLKNAADRVFAGYCETFVTKFGTSGKGLVYSTYLGGSLRDEFGGLALKKSGAVYVTGRTDSTDFPLANPFDYFFNGGWYDAFVTRISASTSGRRSS